MPESASIVEKSWNAYPYTRTSYTCHLFEKFRIDIETVYREDCGDVANVFQLADSELNERAVGTFLLFQPNYNINFQKSRRRRSLRIHQPQDGQRSVERELD